MERGGGVTAIVLDRFNRIIKKLGASGARIKSDKGLKTGPRGAINTRQAELSVCSDLIRLDRGLL